MAGIADHQLAPLVDESAFLGLGAAIQERHHLGSAARAILAETLAGYAQTARGLGASHVTIVGTDPIRRAADGVDIVLDVRALVGEALYALTHEEEAYLTVIGVMEGRPLTTDTLVIDIGGGSSEFCLVGPEQRPKAIGLRLGSDRLTRDVAAQDPPTAADLQAMQRRARAIVAGLPDATAAQIVAVGGTASNLMKVAHAGLKSGNLTRDEAAEALERLVAEPSEMAVGRYGVKPIRARILPAGAVIVGAILERYGATSLSVSDVGIREGAILAVDHAGRGWRDRLPDLAHGWRT